jgi:hypothetical protein
MRIRRRIITAPLAFLLALFGAVAFAAEAQAVTWPKSGTWDCDVLWANWRMSSSTSLVVEPHINMNARAVMARYYAGRIVYYYGPWVNNPYYFQHKTSSVSGSNGTWSGSYIQDSAGGMHLHLLYNGGTTAQRCT